MRRPERFAEALREEIMEIVGYELNDPRLLSVTVTDVVVTENLRDAKVFVLVEGDEQEIKEALKALHHAAPFVKQQVALNLNVRYAPHLHFVRDTVEERANRIDQLLGEMGQGENLKKEESGQ
ncbi:MAG TPA: 30S ribosome-binding factor RbfA [Pyrinomonadaceae bacterium]|jgi:ribosome-binding factor A